MNYSGYKIRDIRASHIRYIKLYNVVMDVVIE
jgi:hypothetical protein